MCVHTLHRVITAALIGLRMCVSSSGFICYVFPLQMEPLQAQVPVIGLLSLSHWAVLNLYPADSWADIGGLSKHCGTAGETLLLSLRKNYNVLQASRCTVLLMIIAVSCFAAVLHRYIPGVCVFCTRVQPILFVTSYTCNNNVIWLI